MSVLSLVACFTSSADAFKDPQYYTQTHQKSPDLSAIARLVQTMLYGKRFFPYYA